MIVSWGAGYHIANSFWGLLHKGPDENRLGAFCILLGALAVGAHMTYKHHKHEISPRKILLLIAVIWVIMPLLGILFWILTY